MLYAFRTSRQAECCQPEMVMRDKGDRSWHITPIFLPTVSRISQSPAKEGGKPGLALTKTLVMPLDGFLQSFGMLETVVKKMVANGVLTPRPAGVANAPAEHHLPARNTSPNPQCSLSSLRKPK